RFVAQADVAAGKPPSDGAPKGRALAPAIRRAATHAVPGIVNPLQQAALHLERAYRCQRPDRLSVAITLPWVSSASRPPTVGNGPGVAEANRFWLTRAETTVWPDESTPRTVATPSAAKPANCTRGGKTITGSVGDGKVPFRSQPTPFATFD